MVSSAKKGKRCVKSRKCKWASAEKYPGQCVPLEQIKHFPCSQKLYMTNPVRLAAHKARKRPTRCTGKLRRCKYLDDCVPIGFRCTKKNADMWNLHSEYRGFF